MKVSEYRLIADALSRFATTREKATGPDTKIGVQCSNGRLKLISGSADAGMVVDVSPCEGKFSYIVEARPFLQAAKVMPAKDTVTIDATEQRLEVVASGGGRVTLNPVGALGEAGLPRKPKDMRASANLYGEKFGQASKVFRAVIDRRDLPTATRDGILVTFTVADGMLYITTVEAVGKAKYANLMADATGEDIAIGVPVEFTDAWKALEQDGTISIGTDGVIAKSGIFECFSRAISQSGLPVMQFKGEGVGFTINRKNLIEVVKGQAPHDEHNRITLDIDTGLLAIRPYGSENGQSVPAQTHGSGVRSVNAEYLVGLLGSIDSREVTVRWAPAAPAISIAAKEYAQWNILMAPVILH
jgi:hypothetical protein